MTTLHAPRLRGISLAFAVAAAACGPAGHDGSTTPSSVLVSRVRSLPPDTTYVFAVSVTKLKMSPAWKALVDPMVQMFAAEDKDVVRGLEDIKFRCGFDPMRDIAWGLFAFEASGDPENGVMLVGGDFDRDKFERCVAAMGIEREMVGAISNFDGLRVAWIDDKVIAMTFDDEGVPFLQRVIATPAGAGGNPGLTAAMSTVDTHAAIWTAGMLTQEENIYDELDLDGDAVAGHASFDVGTDAHARATVRYASVDSAVKATKQLQSFLDEVRKSPFAYFLEAAHVVQTGNEVTATIELDKGRVDSLTAMAQRAIEEQREQRRRWAEESTMPPPDPPVDYEALAREEEARRQEEQRKLQEAEQARLAEQAQTEQASAAQKAENELQAKARTKQGLAYRAAGVHDKAIEEFWAAYTLVPLPELLYNIGLSYDSLKNPASAIEYYRHYVNAEPEGRAADKARERIAKLTKILEKAKRNK